MLCILAASGEQDVRLVGVGGACQMHIIDLLLEKFY